MVVVVVEGNPICCSNRKVQIFICIVPSFVFIGFCFCANNGRGSTGKALQIIGTFFFFNFNTTL
ncbi:hypothetical protein JHK84_029404 [Glycine max]|nr:hypothetical protein JHK84_029404 [Glycine max]